MAPFKFFELERFHYYERCRWLNIEIDSYQFRIYTHLSPYQINLEMSYINRSYMRMWDDDMNRTRLLELLRSRFHHAINVISHDEMVRNGW